MESNSNLKIFTTMRRVEEDSNYSQGMSDYITQVEQHGFRGTLIFQNNTNDIDPWTIAQEQLIKSSFLCPFIAINPVYMHPYTVAQKLLSFAKLYRRKFFLNFITGTSTSDLESLDSLLSHEDRYNRLAEYIEIIWRLITSRLPLSYQGEFYRTKNLYLTSTIDVDLLPEIYIAGSSENAAKIRVRTNCNKLQMAKPINELVNAGDQSSAIHFGIIACSSNKLAREKLKNKFSPRFAEASEILDFSMKNTDSVWKKNLINECDDDIYTVEPFKNLTADCPYIVGSYSEVAEYLINYIKKGSSTFIVEANNEDLEDLAKVASIIIKSHYHDNYTI